MSSSSSTPSPSKTPPATDVYNLDDDNVFIVGGKIIDGYTKADQMDMHRMGKQQELMVSAYVIYSNIRIPRLGHLLTGTHQRNFRLLSAMSFTVLVQATWEFILM
jgi:hypothetical protein